MGISQSTSKTTAEGKALARGDKRALLSLQDYRKKLLAACHASYPHLDRLMLEAAVDTFILHPEYTPEQIVADVPKDYFLNNTVTITEKRVEDVTDRTDTECDGGEGGSSQDSCSDSEAGCARDPPSPLTDSEGSSDRQ